MPKVDKWLSEVPARCDLCGTPIKKTFIDGKTTMGLWAIMCPSCHAFSGAGLGLGRGQQYKESKTKVWMKVAG